MAVGGKGLAIKKKIYFFEDFFLVEKFPTAIKLEGGSGGKALMPLPLRKYLFFAASLTK